MKIYKNFLAETKQEKTAVVTFGRMNPPSIGHVKLAKKIEAEARKHKAEPFIFLSPTQNAKKDPLGPDRKVVYVEKTIGQNINIYIKPTVFVSLSDLYSDGFKRLVFVVGSDRLAKFSKWISEYNGKKKKHGFYDFIDIDFVSSGDRDPDAEGVAGVSASKLREFAVSGDLDNFKKGTKLSAKDTKSMYNEIRKAMKIDTIKESALRPGTKVKVAHPAKGKGMVTGKVVRYDDQGPHSPFYVVSIPGLARSEKVPAHKIKEGAEYPATPAAKKAHLAKIMKKVKDTQAKREKSMGAKIIDRTPDWMFPKEEVEVDEMTKELLYKAARKAEVQGREPAQPTSPDRSGTGFGKRDPNIRRKRRAQAVKFVKGMVKAKEEFEVDEAKIEKQPDDHLKAKMKQLRTSGKTDMPSFQFMIKRIDKEMKKRGLEEDAPPGREKQVKALKKKVGTEKAYAFAWAQHNKHGLPEESVEEEIKHKSYDSAQKAGALLHPADKKSGWVAKSVKAYKQQTKKEEIDRKKFPSRKQIHKMWANRQEKKKKEMAKASHPGYDESVDNLKLKAEQSGIPVKILQKVYTRGISAWNASHRPGTTPQQWAESRVNSFLTGGKTRLITDQDLWTQVDSKHRTKEEMDTNHAFKKWLAFSEGDVVVDTPQGKYVKKGSVASEKMKAKRAFRDQKDKKQVQTRIASPIERKYLQRKEEQEIDEISKDMKVRAYTKAGEKAMSAQTKRARGDLSAGKEVLKRTDQRTKFYNAIFDKKQKSNQDKG